MVEKTCAACDCDLDANSIKVKIGGKTVEVCCDECARNLKEAHASAAAPSEGRDMDGNKIAASVHDEQRRIARPVAALLIGALVIGFYLSAMMPARVDANARVMASAQTSGQAPGGSAVAKNSDSGAIFPRDLLVTPGFRVFKESTIFKENDIMAEKTSFDGNKTSPTRR